MNETLHINIEWDAEADLWYIAESNIPGLVGEAPTWEAMMALLRERVPEMLAENQCPLDDNTPLQVLTRSQLAQLRSRHTANTVLKQAGLPPSF